MTLSRYFHEGDMPEFIRKIAVEEHVNPSVLLDSLTAGRAVLVGNNNRIPFAIGENLSVKVNANVGTSTTNPDLECEVKKVQLAETLGARVISDCSVGGNLDSVRRAMLDNTRLPIATVPIYQAAAEAGSAEHITLDLFTNVLAKHLEDGAQLVVIHLALDNQVLATVRQRTMGMVSRGGLLTSIWMESQKWDAPFGGNFEALFELIHKFNAVLVIGNAARSGCIHDRLDVGHQREAILGEEIAKAANRVGVQVIIEAVGGHVHGPDIATHIQLYKKQGSRPLFAAGPLPIEVGVGHDHISAAIGGTLASAAGADLLCYITPAEHLCLPNIDDVREGMNACLIAAYCGDSMRRGPFQRDLDLSVARRHFDWARQFSLAIDPQRARERHPASENCSMCGEFCPMRDSRSKNKKPEKLKQ